MPSYPPDWPEPGKMHFRLVDPLLGTLDLGCDTGYVVTSYDLGFPEIREVKVPNSMNDGTFDVTRFYGARSITLDVTVKSHTGVSPSSGYRLDSEAVLRDRLTGFLYPGIRPILYFTEPDDVRCRQILLRGSTASRAVSQGRYDKINASWVAPRGILTSYEEQCYRVSFSQSSPNQTVLTLNNQGSLVTDWHATIAGEATKPWFMLESSSGTFMLNLAYPTRPGDVVHLDSYARTVTVNGVKTPYSYVGEASDWFKIPPGISRLTIINDNLFDFAGYPYAYWQPPATPPFQDNFERADGSLGADWQTPSDLPAGTVSVPLAIDDGGVVVTVPDNGAPHEWGFTQYASDVTGGVGQKIVVDVTNLAQSGGRGPIINAHAELLTNMNDADAAAQALLVDFDHGTPPTPTAPVIFTDPFETTDAWTISGTGVSTTASGRTGRALATTGRNADAVHLIAPADRASRIIVGIAFKVPVTTSIRNLFDLRTSDGSGTYGKVLVDVGGILAATDSTGVTKAASPTGTILPNTWYYVEARYTVSKTEGTVALRLGGVDVAGAFQLDTQGISGETGPAQIHIPFPSTAGGTHLYDDLYVATGPDADWLGPQAVPNGSVGWSLLTYAADGSTADTAASGTLPWAYTYDDTPVTLTLESRSDGNQRFVLDNTIVASVIADTPATGPKVGFGLSYESFSYTDPPGGFTDDFERAALGTDWAIPVARSSGKTVVLPTIATGAAVTAGHATNAPQQVYSATTTGTTLVGGVAQNLPGGTSFIAGYLGIARVAQTNGNGTAITASPGWTELGTQIVLGNAAGTFKEPFDHLGAWTPTGTSAIVTGRTGNAVRITGANGSNYIAYKLPTGDATVIAGFAHQVNSLAGIAEVAQFYGDTNVTQHNRVFINTNGSIAVTRGATTLGTSAAGVIAINTWNYIEIRLTLSDTVGTVDVRVNGTSVLALTAQDTKNAGTATVYDTIRLTGPIASFFNQFDDLYILTGGAAAFTGSQTITTPAGVEYLRHATFARIADGTSQDALTVTGGPGDFVSAIESYWQQTAGYAGTDILTRLRYASTTGVSGFADPAALTLGTSNDWLFLESVAVDVTSTFPSISQSSNYSSISGTTTSPGGLVAIRPGYRTATTSGSEDPGAYSGSAFGTRPWIAVTIGLPNAGGLKWGGAENIVHDLDPTSTIAVQAEVNSSATGGPPMIELYSHMITGVPTCRALQVDLLARTYKLGHYAATGDDIVVAASGSLPAGAYPATFRLESDPDKTERFLFNGTLVSTVVDAAAPTPTAATHVGFGEFWTTGYSPSPQVRTFSAVGDLYSTAGPPPAPTSPRIEQVSIGRMSGTDWAIPTGDSPWIQNYPTTRARPTAPTVQEDEVPLTSPGGAPLDDFRGPAPGSAIYDDGWVYDGYGWRNENGQAVNASGQILQTGGQPPNNEPPIGAPPWAWTPAVNPETGEPEIMAVNFCFFNLWI